MTDQSPVDERPSAVAALFVRHPLWEDALALLFGTALVALGIAFYTHAGLLTVGTVGIAFLANYQAGWSFGLVFCLVNLPFYLLGIWRAWAGASPCVPAARCCWFRCWPN